MQRRLFIPLSLPRFGRIASVCLVALMYVMFSATVYAQTDENGLPHKSEYNKDVRTGTWSIYAQGGLSWATGVWYENADAKKSYGMAPAVGGGVDYTIRPWVRVGAEYIWSRYRREQRFSSIDNSQMPMKAYGNYIVNYHNVKLGAGFNIMEIWPKRESQWFNIWFSTGVGYMMAKGNEYGIHFNTTITQDGQTFPADGNINISNTSTVTIQGNVSTTNEHSSFNRFYIPASLHFEFDVTRQFSLGLKGEMDWIIKREEIAPKNLAFALVTARYNFVPGKAKKMKAHYSNSIAALDADLQDALRRLEQQQARAEKAEADKERIAKENEELKNQLEDCINSKPVAVEKPSCTILFDNNSSKLSDQDNEILKAFAEQYKGKTLSLVAEASKPGTKEYNQRLSERRLDRVIKALEKLGFASEELNPSIAIGAQRGIDSAEARRVTITVE